MYSTKPSVFTITKKYDQNTEQYLISIVTYLPVFWYVDFTQPFLIVKGGTHYSNKLCILGVPKNVHCSNVLNNYRVQLFSTTCRAHMALEGGKVKRNGAFYF